MERVRALARRVFNIGAGVVLGSALGTVIAVSLQYVNATGWTTPRTYVQGELVSASMLNTHIRDNENYLKEQTDPSIQLLYSSTTPICNVGGGEDAAMSYTIPAGLLTTNNQAIKLEAHFKGGSTGGTNKRWRAYFGNPGTKVLDSSSSPLGGGEAAYGEVVITRTGATTQESGGWTLHGSSTPSPQQAAPTETLTNAIEVRFTVEGTLDDDLCQRSVRVLFLKTAP